MVGTLIRPKVEEFIQEAFEAYWKIYNFIELSLLLIEQPFLDSNLTHLNWFLMTLTKKLMIPQHTVMQFAT